MTRSSRDPLRLTGAVLLALLAGCASKPWPPADYVVLLPDAQGTVGRVIVKGEQGQQVLSVAGTGVPMDGRTAPAPVPPAVLQRDFGEALNARPLLPLHFVLYFETGGAMLTAESQLLIQQILEAVQQRPAPDVTVVGHTDTLGAADTNTRLALQRAESIANLLRSRGLVPNSLRVESHGEKNPLVPTPDETPEPRNRRVEVSVR